MMRKLRLLAMSAIIVLLAGCALRSTSGPGGLVEPGSLADIGDLNGLTVVVGGKDFTEQQVLCEISAQALTSVGATVYRECGMSGSATVRAALESGGIDTYWEYTGTGWVSHLGETDPIKDPVELWTTLSKLDAKQNGIVWLDPAPANNTYAVAVASEMAEKLNVTTISEYAELAQTEPDQASFCGAAEFFGRNDGWPGLMDAYGFTLPKANVSELATGAVYNGIDTQKPCNFGEVFATDGRIKALDLTILQDDRRYFTPYNAALTFRAEVIKEYPQTADIMAPISKGLTAEVLQELNAEVDVDGTAATDVANSWLKREGFIGQ